MPADLYEKIRNLPYKYVTIHIQKCILKLTATNLD